MGSEYSCAMRRSPLRRSAAYAWLRLLRPATSIGLGLTAALCAVAWTDGAGPWHEPLRYGLALLLLAAAAAAANDSADAQRDASVRVWRPLPAAAISARAARAAAALLAAGGLALCGSLGWQPLLIGLALAATGGVYSYAWRGALGGAAAFALAALLVPLGAALAGGAASSGALWWVAPVGAASGLAFFIVYKLPDFERDDADGARSILHWAGIDLAVPMAWAAVALALALALSSINLDGNDAVWVLAPLAYLLAATIGATAALLRQVTEQRLWWQRVLLCPGLLALIVGWLGAMAPA